MIVKYKNLEASVEIALTSVELIKDLAPSLIRNKNLKEDQSLTYDEVIDESLITLVPETAEERIFLLNDSLETSKPTTLNEELKLNARKRIAEEVGDIYDLFSDLSKRMTMLERLTVRLTDDLIKHSPENIPVVTAAYSDFIANYLAMQSAYSEVTSIADLEDPAELFAKLFSRSIKTTEIIKEDYMDKKE